jgi:hypothetical protein
LAATESTCCLPLHILDLSSHRRTLGIIRSRTLTLSRFES